MSFTILNLRNNPLRFAQRLRLVQSHLIQRNQHQYRFIQHARFLHRAAKAINDAFPSSNGVLQGGLQNAANIDNASTGPSDERNTEKKTAVAKGPILTRRTKRNQHKAPATIQENSSHPLTSEIPISNQVQILSDTQQRKFRSIQKSRDATRRWRQKKKDEEAKLKGKIFVHGVPQSQSLPRVGSLQRSKVQMQALANLPDLRDKPLTDALKTLMNGQSNNVGGITCDKKRMNIVSDSLCDDVINRLAPSLEKHRGCDIIDINPGVGMFSSKLHDFLRPRTHILMDDDEQLYGSGLRRYVDTDPMSYKYIPESGMIWNNLDSLHEKGMLPNQRRHLPGASDLYKPNDSLLLVANLGYHPPRKSQGFTSLATLMIHQLFDSINHQSGVQRYGQVRMLIWMHDREKKQILPRNNTLRRKTSIQVETACQGIIEVVGADKHVDHTRRDHSIDLAVAYRVQNDMHAENIATPSQRLTTLQRELETLSSDDMQCLQYSRLPYNAQRVYDVNLRNFEEAHATLVPSQSEEISSLTSKPSPLESEQVKGWRQRVKSSRKLYSKIEECLIRYDQLIAEHRLALHHTGADSKGLNKALHQEIAAWIPTKELSGNDYTAFVNAFADHLLARQEPPALAWDRRPYEPLLATSTEFYPEAPMALLDLQPRPPWLVFRDSNPTRYDTFEMILSGLWMIPTQSIIKALKSLAPGADDWIIPRCPSLSDAEFGGCPNLNLLSVRMLNLRHYKDIIEAWLQWPLAPSRFEMMRKYSSQGFDEDGGESEPSDVNWTWDTD